MAEQKRPSVADILAAARKADGGGAKEATSAPAAAPSTAPSTAPSASEEVAATPAAEPAAPAKEAAPAKPAAAKPAAAKPAGGRPSVAEMMALARAEKEKAAGGAPAQAPKAEKPVAAEAPPAPKPAPEKEKPAAKAAPSKVAPAKAAAKEAAGKPLPKDTASILAAARKEHKPGPMSKSEAAAIQSKSAAVAAPEKPKSKAAPPMPPKPEYAVRKAAKPAVDEGRRLALMSMLVGSSLALGFSTMTATLTLWTLGLARFMFPNILREPPSQFKVGFPSDFAPGQVETKFIPQFGVWVVNGEYNGIPQIYALMAVCTHLGCTPNWLEAEQKFKCPCHGSGFYKDGINFEGPAPRPLERYAIRLADDGQLEIDKSRTFHEEMGAWEDPTSFVSV